MRKILGKIDRPFGSAAFALLVLALFCSSVFTQDFVSGFSNFAISFDGEVSTRHDRHYSNGDRVLFGEVVVLSGDEESLTVAVFEILDLTGSRSMVRTKLTPAIRQDVFKNIESQVRSEGTSFTKTPYSKGQYSGFELRSTEPMQRIDRVFFSGDRLIAMHGFGKAAGSNEKILNAMNSYRVPTRNERIVALIDECIPDNVPNERPKQWFHSDLQIRKLNGRVRMARETKRTGTDVEFLHETRFDEDGFVTIEIGFNSGFPEMIAVWGWANEIRVDREVAVRYHFGDRPFFTSRFIVSGQTTYNSPEEAETSELDLRYGTRYDRTFDNSDRILSETRRANNGTLITARKFTYAGRTVNMVARADGDLFFEHIRQTLDENGNVVLEETLSETGSVLSSKRFTYKFDDRGNWIERKQYGRVGIGRRATEKLIETVDREIAYYAGTADRNIGQFMQRADNRSVR